MPAAFYQSLPESLSQGDIIAGVPWGLVEAPISLCRPVDASKTSGKAFYSTADPWELPKNFSKPWSRTPETIHAAGRKGLGMVLWHGCEIDKFENQGERIEKAFAAVAPVIALEELQAPADKKQQLHDDVRNNQHNSYFFLPAITDGPSPIPESFVNLRYIWSVRQTALANRVLSVHPHALMALYEKLFIFFTRYRLDIDPSCPKCGAAVPLVMSGGNDD